MTLSAYLVGEPAEVPVHADGAGEILSRHALEAKAGRLHDLGRLRMRHLGASIMADHAMNVMLSLVLSECRGLSAGEQSIILANYLAPLEGAALIDNLVQAGLTVATGKMPGRRTVGLTPLGSARMRAYISGFPDL